MSEQQALEYAGTYLTESGDDCFIAINDCEVVRWVKSEWQRTTPTEKLFLQFDLSSAVVVRTWQTTIGALDDLRERFFKPKEHRDLTKRPYSSFRNTGILPSLDDSVEEPGLSWLLHRLHRISNFHHE